MISEGNYTYGTSPRKYDDYIPAKQETADLKMQVNVMTATSKAILLKALFYIAIAVLFMLCTTAYISQIEYSINEKATQIQSVQSEIASLNLAVERQSTIEVIEARATTELGMVYPSAGQLVFLDGSFNAAKTLANK